MADLQAAYWIETEMEADVGDSAACSRDPEAIRKRLRRTQSLDGRVYSLAMLASVFLEEERDRKAPHWQGHVTIGEACRTT